MKLLYKALVLLVAIGGVLSFFYPPENSDMSIWRALWPQPQGWHFFVSRGLRWVRPVLKPQYWFRENPWTQQDVEHVWFVLDVPPARYPFVSYRGKHFAFYAGWKQFNVDPDGEDAGWAPDAMPIRVVTFSARWSRDHRIAG